MRMILRIFSFLLLWSITISVVGTNGLNVLVFLTEALRGMPVIFIIDASYMYATFFSSVITLVLYILIIHRPKIKRSSPSNTEEKT